MRQHFARQPTSAMSLAAPPTPPIINALSARRQRSIFMMFYGGSANHSPCQHPRNKWFHWRYVGYARPAQRTGTQSRAIWNATKRSAHQVRTGLHIGRDFRELIQHHTHTHTTTGVRRPWEGGGRTWLCVCERASTFGAAWCSMIGTGITAKTWRFLRLVWRTLAQSRARVQCLPTRVSCILLYGKLQLYSGA